MTPPAAVGAGPAARRRLRRHYRATCYRVDAPGGPVALRVGVRAAALAALLRQTGHRRWAVVTAWNPASRPLPARQNRRRQRRLLRELRARGALLFPAVATADAGDWPPEPGLLALGLPEREALALAAAFGQYAIVCGGRDGRARLRWT